MAELSSYYPVKKQHVESDPPLNIDMTVRDDQMGRMARTERQGIRETVKVLNGILRKMNSSEEIVLVKKRHEHRRD